MYRLNYHLFSVKTTFSHLCFTFFGRIILLVAWLFGACEKLPSGDPDNGGLYLPEKFEAVVVIDSLEGRARHIVVRENGDLFVKLRFPGDKGGCMVLRDRNGDGKADTTLTFAPYGKAGKWSLETGMFLYKGYVYYSSELVVYRQRLRRGKMAPDSKIDTVLIDDHPQGKHEHIAKPLAFDDQGHMYVPFGAPSNACQEPKRTPGQPGLDPCPQLVDHGGIWRFDADKLHQTQEDGIRYATGIRSVVAMDWNTQDKQLYVVMHGRDDLLRLFPHKFTPWQSALLPSEEFMRVKQGMDFGWPYCYYDQMQAQKVLAPEYGGDGQLVERCDTFDTPIMGFPGHWAPNGLYFYKGDQFPKRYKNGAFVAFHGSTNRAPYPQSGYFVGFIPFENGQPTGEWEVFADGFASIDTIVNVNDAHYRPMGIAEGPDGSLYLSDTEKGKIWRVMYKGDKRDFGTPQLAAMDARKQLPHIKTPDVKDDILQRNDLTPGAIVYQTYCAACHQKNGKGAAGRFPPLAGTDWVTGDKSRLIQIILNGMEGEIMVNGEGYNNVMPQHSFLSDEEIARVLTYIRQHFGNNASAVTVEEVEALRK